MVKVSDYNARAVGFPWVRKEDYVAFLAICEDADGLPAGWEQFTKFTEEAESRVKAKGYAVVRAYIDPETFSVWCAKNGARVNSEGRMKFAASVAAEQYGRDNA